jgi:AraC-like DNA-binding protein
MERQDGGPLEREELMYQVLSLTASHLIAKPPMPSGRDQRAALRAQAFVHEHYASDIRAAGLATAVGVSESSVAHAFKQAFQCSPGVYQTALRLSEARRLIGAGMPIAEVAVAVGFADQSHFSRRFKAAFGVTPGKCRQVCSTCADQASSGSAIFSV